MDTKNTIIQNYANSLVDAASAVAGKTTYLNDNVDENIATIKTINILLESVRSQTVILQQEIDKYN